MFSLLYFHLDRSPGGRLLGFGVEMVKLQHGGRSFPRAAELEAAGCGLEPRGADLKLAGCDSARGLLCFLRDCCCLLWEYKYSPLTPISTYINTHKYKHMSERLRVCDNL